MQNVNVEYSSVADYLKYQQKYVEEMFSKQC
jgi:hypothetical protein